MSEDAGLKIFSGAVSLVVNGIMLGGMIVAGLFSESEASVDAPLDFIEVEVMPLPALGEEPDPKLLKRIVEAPEPEVETDIAGFKPKDEAEEIEPVCGNGKVEEGEECDDGNTKNGDGCSAQCKIEKEDEQLKKRQLAEEKRRLDAEERRLQDEKRKLEKKEKRDRKKAMAKALKRVRDPRADEDNPDGFAEGDAAGTSTDPQTLRNKAVYVSRVELVLSRQFPELGSIPANERKRLRATVHFKIDDSGKVVGQARVVKKSGNALFDREAVRTVMKFSGGGLKIPVPKASERDLRKYVLAKGISARMRAQK